MAALFCFTPGAARGATEAEAFRAYLSRDTIGAAEFTSRNPEWDGRGDVVVAVLDTGIDMSAPGLRELPQGGTKVIEARDFSGQGDVTLRRAEVIDQDGRDVLRTDDGWAHYPRELPLPPIDGRYWLGFLDEARFAGSNVTDINANGREDDTFAFLVVRAGPAEKPRWVIYPDRDGDRDFTGEAPVRDYVVNQEVFTFGGAPPEGPETPLVFAATVVDEGARPTLSLHTADHSHGTHCAGIAAGFALYDRDGFDGDEAIPISVTRRDAGEFALYPGVPVELELLLARVPPALPDGFEHLGELTLIEGRRERVFFATRFTWRGEEQI